MPFGGVAGAEKAEDRVPAVAVVFSAGHGGDLDQVLHVLGSKIGCLQVQAAGAVGCFVALGQPCGLGGQVVRDQLHLPSGVLAKALSLGRDGGEQPQLACFGAATPDWPQPHGPSPVH